MTGNNWAIVVGINQYEHHAERQLHYAVRDAELVKSFLCDHAGFASHQVIECLGEATNRGNWTYPNLSNLLRLLNRDLSPERVGQVDRLWFFFGGHGLSRNGQDYLLTADSLVEDIDLQIALSVKALTASLRRHTAADIVLILDNCRTLVGSRNIGAPAEPANSEQTLQLSRERGITTIFGCGYGQASHELSTIQQGAFTYALVEGLKQFTLPIHLEAYLQRRVRALNRQANYWEAQTPHIEGAMAAQAVRQLLPLPLSSQELDVLLSRAKQESNLEQAKVWWQSVIDLAPSSQQRDEAKRELERLREKQRLESKPQPESKPFPAIPQSGSKPTKAAKPTLATFRFEVVTIAAIGRGFLGFGAPKVELASHWGQAQCFTEDLGNGVGLEMVSIPGGAFFMGSPDPGEAFFMGSPETGVESCDVERPRHMVRVNPFFIGKYPVTQAQWFAVSELPKINCDLDPNCSFFKGLKRPVETVNWYEAVEFCDRLSRKTGRQYRLPSEAEWEYACRAGTTTPFHFGETLTTDLANYCGTDFYEKHGRSGSYGQGPKGEFRDWTTDVGSFPPNAFGLYDMHGNVCEWCLDYYHDNYQGAPTDGSAWVTGSDSERGVRGGSRLNEPRHCRSACRFKYPPDFRAHPIGFRVACAAP